MPRPAPSAARSWSAAGAATSASTAGRPPVAAKQDLPLVDLCGAAGLGRIGQDAWLTACDEVHDPVTQQWATAIRRWAPNAAGIVWMSKRDNVREAAVLFADRVPAGALSGRGVRALDSPLGFALVTKVLAEFNMAVA